MAETQQDHFALLPIHNRTWAAAKGGFAQECVGSAAVAHPSAIQRRRLAPALRYVAGMFTATRLRIAMMSGLCIAILAIAIGAVFAQSPIAIAVGQPQDVMPEAFRWDTHPIVLAFIQLVGVLAAVIFFPRPGVARLAWLEEDVRTVFRRSYRASFFGS